MHASAHAALPFPLSLVASGLVFVAALVLLVLAALHWRHAGRHTHIRDHRILSGWRVTGTAYALWGLALLGLGGLSLVYPFDGRQFNLPPDAHVGLALEIAAYALVPVGVVVLVVGRVLLGGAYR